MGMSTYILDNQQEFYDIADKNIGNFKNISEFEEFMMKHIDLLRGTENEYWIPETIQEIWQEKWSKYQ
jgi:hypothetical protein